MKKRFLFYLMIVALLLGALSACGKTGITVTVTFISQGNTYDTQTTASEKMVSLPTDPKLDGYTFDAWYYDDGVWQKPFTTQSFLDMPLTENMTIRVYAHFIEDKPQTTTYTATISFISQGQTIDTKTTASDKMVSLPDNPSLDGYAFDTWYFDDGVWKKPFNEQSFLALSLTENTSINVYAHFEKVVTPAEMLEKASSLYKNRNPLYISFIATQNSEQRQIEWYENDSVVIAKISEGTSATNIYYIDKTRPSETGSGIYACHVDSSKKVLIPLYSDGVISSYKNYLPQIAGSGEECKYSISGKEYTSLKFVVADDVFAYFIKDNNSLSSIVFANGDNSQQIKYDIYSISDSIPVTSELFGIDKYAKDTSKLAFITPSDSMKPALEMGQMHYYARITDSTQLNVGDIILVQDDSYGYQMTYAHRIESISNENGSDVYTLKGDNNPMPDQNKYTRSEIIGVLDDGH